MTDRALITHMLVFILLGLSAAGVCLFIFGPLGLVVGAVLYFVIVRVGEKDIKRRLGIR